MVQILMSRLLICLFLVWGGQVASGDHVSTLQTQAIEENRADFGHWGWDAEVYTRWGSHSNRLIPVYTFGTLNAGPGIDLQSYTGTHSVYRSEEKLSDLYGEVPAETLNPNAEYLDQTDIYRIQAAALAAGKKHIILVVFDGMDWQTTWAASIGKLNRVVYESGRGTGLHFQDYTAGGNTQFGSMVTSPYIDDANTDVDQQTVELVADSPRGGYAFAIAGSSPWESPTHLEYLVSRKIDREILHAYTDSASSATSMTAGIKTYNAAINIDHQGQQVPTIAHLAQSHGYKIGVVTSVPISHATPAAAYSHNVHRNDFQDLTNDLLGVPSVSHPETPLPGVDVLIGCGYGENRTQDAGQGENFIEGNAYLTQQTLQQIDLRSGGQYVVAMRQPGVSGREELLIKAQDAADQGARLFGFFGVKGGHLPFQTANGNFQPTVGRKKTAEAYTEADLKENPTLSDMTTAALTVMEQSETGFWLMVEAGDVDWANHDNNIDNSIGAVLSGDAAVKVITDWVEQHSSWDETVLIVTADHGHLLVLTDPQILVKPETEAANNE